MRKPCLARSPKALTQMQGQPCGHSWINRLLAQVVSCLHVNHRVAVVVQPSGRSDASKAERLHYLANRLLNQNSGLWVKPLRVLLHNSSLGMSEHFVERRT